MNAKICGNCHEENNPSLVQCWKCGNPFEIGAVNSGSNKKPVNWFWPSMTSLENVERAVKEAFVASVISAVLTAVISILPLFGKSLLSFNYASLVDAVLILALGWGIKRKSRSCAILLLVYFVIAKIDLAIETSGKNLSFMTFVFFLCYLNGARGAFAYHRFKKSKVIMKCAALKIVLSLIYGFLTFAISCVALLLIHGNPTDMMYSLCIIPALLIIWAVFEKQLPFTKYPITTID